MCARGAPYDHFGRTLAFYSPGVGLLDADWLQRVSCGALIGWRFAASDVITSCCRCKGAAAIERFLRLATDIA